MIAEALTRPVGFVLGGTGSLGASQVGMLPVLAEHRIVADLVVGSSVGSLNGAVVALDPAGAASRLSHAWARMTAMWCSPAVFCPGRGHCSEPGHACSLTRAWPRSSPASLGAGTWWSRQ